MGYKPVFFGAVCLALAGCAAFGVFERYVPGRYTGEGDGLRGPVRVLVETGSFAIVNIEVTESREDEWAGGVAIAELIDLVLEQNSSAVDAISGATLSSEAFLAAVDRALAKAAPPRPRGARPREDGK